MPKAEPRRTMTSRQRRSSHAPEPGPLIGGAGLRSSSEG
jgi:hypothetical protein